MSEVGDARVTPYDLIFGPPGFDEVRFADIRAQAGDDGAPTPAALVQLSAAGELLRELLPPDDGDATHSAVFTQVSTLVFHAFTYWNAGHRLYRLAEGPVRAVLAGGDDNAAAPVTPPALAGYVQLPRNVIWAQVDEATAAEPVDGFFWSAATVNAVQRLDVLLVLGVRRGRPGVSIIDVALDDAATLAQWAVARVRPVGNDFANVLPGGELQDYHAVTLHAEVLKLAALCFRLINAANATQPFEAAGASGDSVSEVDG